MQRWVREAFSDANPGGKKASEIHRAQSERKKEKSKKGYI